MLREVQKRGLESRILLPGYLSHEKVAALRCMSAVNLCLMGGFSLIEACASGRPVISYDVEWHSELVRDRVTGRLINENEVEEVVKAAEEFLSDPRAAESMGNAARELAFERHRISRARRAKKAVYEELLHG
jgi:glycosyltransferase involved in cell wall biosynthesis